MLDLLPHSWPATIAFASAGLVMALLYSPVADKIGTCLAAVPPKLGAFQALKTSTLHLLAGIVVAWILGGFIEEIALRGIVVRYLDVHLQSWMPAAAAATIAVCAAAAIAFIVHLYQGLRGAVIVTQISILFGALYVLSGHNLWAVILCHGSYDTIAFVRFARGTSRYSR